MNTAFRQRGGTFLGIIVGVLAGLAAALAVAIYVAKVPTPFTNQNQSRTSSQDEAEARRNENWDPNAPLRGKRPSTTGTVGGVVPPAVAPEPEPVVPPEPADASPERPEPAVAERDRDAERRAEQERQAEAQRREAERRQVAAEQRRAEQRQAEAERRRTQPAQSSDPLGDLARERAGASGGSTTVAARTAAPAAADAGPAGSDPFTYFVQAGAFRTSDDAEAQRARLALMGVNARVTERELSGRTVYRVRVGPFNQKAGADRAKAQLDSAGVESALVRVQR